MAVKFRAWSANVFLVVSQLRRFVAQNEKGIEGFGMFARNLPGMHPEICSEFGICSDLPAKRKPGPAMRGTLQMWHSESFTKLHTKMSRHPWQRETEINFTLHFCRVVVQTSEQKIGMMFWPSSMAFLSLWWGLLQREGDLNQVPEWCSRGNGVRALLELERALACGVPRPLFARRENCRGPCWRRGDRGPGWWCSKAHRRQGTPAIARRLLE